MAVQIIIMDAKHHLLFSKKQGLELQKFGVSFVHGRLFFFAILDDKSGLEDVQIFLAKQNLLNPKIPIKISTSVFKKR